MIKYIGKTYKAQLYPFYILLRHILLLEEDIRCLVLNCFISSDGVCCSKVVKTELSESKETKKEQEPDR